jgi:hypothetical protein
MSSLSLYERFEKIPDPRRPAGTRYSLASILALVVAAVLCGRISLRSIARWGKTLTQSQLLDLGIKRGRAPGQTAMHELLCRLPASEVEKALGEWIGELAAMEPSRQIVLDGKTLRASAGGEYPALHLLAAYCPQVNGVLFQQPADGKDNEITAAKKMLKTLPVKGAVVTGDAMFCQRALCETISQKGGDFLFVAKENQETLLRDIETAFSPSFSPEGKSGTGKSADAPRDTRKKARSSRTANS